MTSTTTYKAGDSVRLTTGPLGVLERDDDVRFVPDVLANRGDVGTYRGAHADLDGWHRVTIAVDGVDYIVPVHATMIEAAS